MFCVLGDYSVEDFSKSILNVKRRKRLLITVDNFIGVAVGGCIF